MLSTSVYKAFVKHSPYEYKMDLYKCAYRDPKSPLTPINPMNTHTFEYGSGTLKTALSAGKKSPSYSVTPLSSRDSNSCTTVALGEPAESTRYYTLVPQKNNSDGTFAKISSNVSSTTNRTSQKTACQKIMEKVYYEDGEVVKVSRCELKKETFFRRASPCLRSLCPKVSEWLKSSGLERFSNLFMKEEIDYKALLLMDEDDLKVIGICYPRDRALLLALIRRKRDYWNFR